MSYETYCQQRTKTINELREKWENTKSDEDRKNYFTELGNYKEYLTVDLKIWPGDEFTANQIQEMLQDPQAHVTLETGHLIVNEKNSCRNFEKTYC